MDKRIDLIGSFLAYVEVMVRLETAHGILLPATENATLPSAIHSVIAEISTSLGQAPEMGCGLVLTEPIIFDPAV